MPIAAAAKHGLSRLLGGLFGYLAAEVHCPPIRLGTPDASANAMTASGTSTNNNTDAKASLGDPRSLNDLTISTSAAQRCITDSRHQKINFRCSATLRAQGICESKLNRMQP